MVGTSKYILHVLCYNLNLDLVSEYKEYWIKDLHLEVHDEQVLKEQESLTDKHMNAAASLLSQQFPDLPPIQCTLYSNIEGRLQKAENNSVFFHSFSNHWCVSYFKEDTVQVYDSLQPKTLNQTLKKQLLDLYGNKKGSIVQVQKQRGVTDCGCFTLAFTFSILCGDNPSLLVYDQSRLREHILQCFNAGFFQPFPSTEKKAKRQGVCIEFEL